MHLQIYVHLCKQKAAGEVLNTFISYPLEDFYFMSYKLRFQQFELDENLVEINFIRVLFHLKRDYMSHKRQLRCVWIFN